MGDLTITGESVLAGAGSNVAQGTFGATITQGIPVYLDGSSQLQKCDTTSSTKAACVGITLNSGAAGQPASYLTSGPITIGATVATGTTYALSDTSGLIALASDNGSGDYITILGVATSTTVLNVRIQASGVAKP